MRIRGRHHRSGQASAGGMKPTDQPIETKVRFAPSLRTAAELVAESEAQHRTAG